MENLSFDKIDGVSPRLEFNKKVSPLFPSTGYRLKSGKALARATVGASVEWYALLRICVHSRAYDVREERTFESFLRENTLYSFVQNKALIFFYTGTLFKKHKRKKLCNTRRK